MKNGVANLSMDCVLSTYKEEKIQNFGTANTFLYLRGYSISAFKLKTN